MRTNNLTVLAIAAHPDDIEFVMAGTLLLLKDAGAGIHMWNLSSGGLGTMTYSYEAITQMRWEEAQASAREAGATMHLPIAQDLLILYTPELLARVTSVIRQVKPDIVLTHSPQDYMEDHMNACRLAVSGAFARGMPNYVTDPPMPAWEGSTVVYHAMPHGLRDSLRRLIRAEHYIDISSVIARKRSMLAQHVSQKAWLDASQGMDSYLIEMESLSRKVAQQCGRFQFAEGWRRHSHLGFASADADPLRDALQAHCWTDPAYEELLDHQANCRAS